MSKREKLTQLKTHMEADESLPLKRGSHSLVFGNGTPNSALLFIGEGPGFHEDQQGKPFVGNAGNLLNQLLASISLERDKVFITNVVHHRPPENRDPSPTELLAYGKYLDQIIEIIDPKIIVTLGRFSMGKFLPNQKISSIHGGEFKVKWHQKDLVIVPMYHPAAALRNPTVMTQIKEDFLKLPKIIEKVTKVELKQENLI